MTCYAYEATTSIIKICDHIRTRSRIRIIYILAVQIHNSCAINKILPQKFCPSKVLTWAKQYPFKTYFASILSLQSLSLSQHLQAFTVVEVSGEKSKLCLRYFSRVLTLSSLSIPLSRSGSS